MSDTPASRTKEFEHLVRDALLNLNDPSRLETHPLAAGAPASGAIARGKWLYRLLLDGIAALRPTSGTPTTSRSWRTYRILELRYIDGCEVADIVEELAVSKMQYYRDYHRALQAVSSVIWDRWQADARRQGEVPGAATIGQGSLDDLTRREARSLALSDDAESDDLADPREVIAGVESLLRPLSFQQGVDLDIRVKGPLATVKGDRVALRQALLLAVTEVMELVGRGHVQVVAEQLREQVEIRVIGSPATPPSEALAASTPGVSRCLPFVEALGGTVDNLTGVGQSVPSGVRLRLPVGSQPSLLVVDNNPDFIRLVEHYLTQQGWEVIGTSNTRDALVLVRQGGPRVVLLDVVMPGHDGWELLTELRRDSATRELPVIICSVLNEPKVAISLGATAYLQKPVDRLRLVEALRPFRLGSSGEPKA